MFELFGAAFDDAETYGAAQPCDAYLERLLASETFIAVAVTAGADVVGGLAGYVLPKFERERSELYIYYLAVAASHRRRDVATTLIGELQRVAAARDIWVIFVQADESDEPAI